MRRRLIVVLSAVSLAFASTAAAQVPPKDYLSDARVGPACWSSSDDANDALLCWLNLHPDVANAMEYHDATFNGPWPSWPKEAKAELFVRFDEMVTWYHAGKPPNYPEPFPMPVPNDPPNDPVYGYRLSEAMGRTVYLSEVANSLAVELTAAVNWSITTYTQAELDLLLTMSQLLWYAQPPNVIQAGYYFAYGGPSPAPPGYTVRFFDTNLLLAGDATTTVGRLFEWERQLQHYYVTQGQSWPDYTDFWGPNTPPIPEHLIIEGTNYQGSGPFGHYTAGCSGTSHFMKSVLRAVNIPVQRHWVACQHATPIFPTIGLAMTHGDDPYNWAGYVTPFPQTPSPVGTDYLVTNAEFDQLFPPGQTWDECTHKVGFGWANVAVEFISDHVMNLYCQDLASNASHANGQVFGFLSWYFPLSTLENMGFWATLDNKVATVNWCQQ